ncbi:SET domain-containing protein [Virgibacillus halodenitrificans]|uniref:SET domain-containing protein n=1 Tax=Virgibacillus halodenitrificans TaxID=1482 RepID=UPI002DBB04B0|nr:SET domain-containing protein [Virgibacillus halodenitrificans]MEC2159374.1 SET domain-containing protein [Virgibacillus halodenitrificans]
MQKIGIKDTGKYGRGVFALVDLREGELIEAAPAVVLSKSDRKLIKETKLVEYFFNWKRKKPAIALGYGSLYNHSYTPNAKFVNNPEQITIDFYALKDIKKGEEISVNYNGDPDDNSNVWFDVLK